MARNRKIAAASDADDGPRDPARRALIAFGAPAAGAGLAALLGRPRPASAETADHRGEDDSDGGGLTAHREAYYRRARF